VAKTLCEQLRGWAHTRESSEASDDDSRSRPDFEHGKPLAGPIHTQAGTLFPRDWRQGIGRFEIPKSIIEAEVRLRECEESVARIESQLQERASDTPDHEGWKRRAETARRGFEYEISRLTTCIRVFRQEAASDKVGFAMLEKERDDAREVCRNLATEVERLSRVVKDMPGATKEAAVSRAFMEVAELVLSEVTFQRILSRARNKARSKAPQ
jgi:hypothetical protein